MADRPRPVPATDGPAARRTAGVAAVLVITAVVLVGLSLWTVRGLVGAGGASAGELELDGGVLRVTSVTPEVMAHPKEMPASMMPDPVPSGFRRVAVDVVLVGRSQAGLAYDAADFRLGGPDVEPVAADREGLGSGVVPEGARLDATLVFEVPETAQELTLSVAGREDGVRIDLPDAAGHDGGHDDAHAPQEPVGGVSVEPPR